MKKLALIIGLFLINSGFSATNLELYNYADIYSDQLLKEFDRELDLAVITKTNPLESLSYARLQAARSYMESLVHHHHTSKKQFISPTFNSSLFSDVKKIIDQDAKEIFFSRQEMIHEIEKNKQIDPPYAYPSVSTKGNLFGNDFPKNVWAITFDDGPRNVKTEAVIDNLLARNIRATFFMLTGDAKKFPKAARDARDRGMDIALHSYDHSNLPKVSAAKLKYEITDAKKDLEDLLKVDIKYFRLPYGAGVHTSRIRKLIAENNLIHVFWNIDSLDWKDHNPESVLSRVKKLISLTPNHSGIVLFHDIHASTLEASRLVIDYLLEKENKLCSIKEIVDGLNGKAQSCY